MQSREYGKRFDNLTKNQFCFGIVFDEFDYENQKFKYTLRFNVSNPFHPDHPDPTF